MNVANRRGRRERQLFFNEQQVEVLEATKSFPAPDKFILNLDYRVLCPTIAELNN